MNIKPCRFKVGDIVSLANNSEFRGIVYQIDRDNVWKICVTEIYPDGSHGGSCRFPEYWLIKKRVKK